MKLYLYSTLFDSISCPTLPTTVLRLFPFVGKVAYLSSTADFQLLLINMSHHQLGFATVLGSL